MTTTPDLDKFRGLLLGAIVGDALGMPYQFLHPQVVRESFSQPTASYQRAPAGHVNAGAERGQYTDETQLMTIVIESMLESGDLDPPAIAQTMLRMYTDDEWITPGRSIVAACRNLDKGRTWHAAGGLRDGSKPLAMVPPIVLRFFTNIDAILHHSASLARIILVEPRVLKGCSCFGLLLKNILMCRDPYDLEEAVRRTAAYMEDSSPSFRDMLQWVLTLLDTDIDEGLQELGTGYSILESLFASLFAFLKFPDDYGRAVSHVVYHGDSSDVTGFITGAFCGAYAGYAAIPEPLVNGLKDSQFFLDLAEAFYDAVSTQPS
ncbi:MAG: ADP-ribosylglycohydrolase family protein [Acidobacteria bacterium]|nr:ADP-ribosylglycohydrolase family protein [Acidobacteriota bacterium]